MAKSKKKSKTLKPPPVKTTPAASINECSPIPATINIASQPVLMKVCRLCGAKDGPFLNIFDPEQVTASKIDQLMPFKVAENDDLPHKICFRCSAKVEELHEFVQKCINTQENLHGTMGKKAPVIVKTKTRSIWEEKLNKTNLSNDDICDALIRRAMEGIKDIPVKALPLKEEKEIPTKGLSSKNRTKSPSPAPALKEDISFQTDDKSDEVKKVKLNTDNCDTRITRASRSSNPDRLDKSKRSENKNDDINENKSQDILSKSNKPSTISNLSFDYEDDTINEIAKKKKKSDASDSIKNDPPTNSQVKEFNIMDHVTMIKVNGVGVLFQCKLCTRNFLKKDVVMSHGCAKNGVPKVDFTVNIPPPEPPKVTTVKYINTKVNNESKKPTVEEVSKPPVKETKPKPKIGPASKIRRNQNDTNSEDVTTATDTSVKVNQSQPVQAATPATSQAPTVNFPAIPSLQGRYKLMPGPNNTFTLVEDTNQLTLVDNTDVTSQPQKVVLKSYSKKPKSDDVKKAPVVNNSNKLNDKVDKSKAPAPTYCSEIVNLDDEPNPEQASVSQPYPVGLFQTVNHCAYPPPPPEQPPFTTPAMKKQSYTIVQTGNPNKLLISTKPQAPVEEVPKKRTKKVKASRAEDESKEPFSVTLEDANHPKDPGFFTFINVDPLLQPSYVLPTDNIIQESQISTSTSVAIEAAESKEKNKYSCNMCNETFSREKKLLTHILSHYNKIDEEYLGNIERTKNNSRKRKR